MSMFRRRVVIVSSGQIEGGEVRAALEDDFHHFRVSLRHEHGVLSQVTGQALRFPYSACPEAIEPLHALSGMVLSPIAHSVTRETDARHQCTHLLDLAGLAVAAALRPAQVRRYDIQVPMRLEGRTQAMLQLNGQPLLEWQVKGAIIEDPQPFSGVNIREGMARWALNTLTPDLAEAALLLRRCTMISIGKTHDLDSQIHASSTDRCFSQQTIRAPYALRIKGSTWDIASNETLCAADADWLKECTQTTC
ncbi:DUF2889 domain-containing protein [Pseudomonas abietaniphila]|uniref:DUF2889 domain-containing protein n=2 Tax=Pseudomonas TaxID=286 RepID=A0A1G7VA72_9PSED|nr:DUF2889 domain-containing protein [Pseudomonas abietaniphila]SDG56696.1 Protein of unknown function [Pseudomonas abietaniphila]